MDKNDSDSEGDGDLFREPEDYYQPEKQPTVVQHRTISGQNLKLRLIGSSPLWVGLAFPPCLFSVRFNPWGKCNRSQFPFE